MELDVRLQKKLGLELLNKIKLSLSDIKNVFLSYKRRLSDIWLNFFS